MNNLSVRVLEELRRNAILMRRSFRGGQGQLSLNVGGQSRMLTILLENPGMSQKTLSDLLHVRPQTLGEQLSRLESNGLIERRPNEYDRRVLNLYLTEAGAAEAKAVADRSEETLGKIFSGITEEELTTLLALVEKLNAAIENSVDPSALAPPSHRHGPHGPHGHHGHHGISRHHIWNDDRILR